MRLKSIVLYDFQSYWNIEMVKGYVKIVNGKRVATPEYRSWQMAKNRCFNKNARDYKYYGGRGVSMCKQWATSFDAFLGDLGERPAPEYTLDRIDTEGDYTPENCRWATRKDQARNREYAKRKAWLVSTHLGVSSKTYYHYIWQLKCKSEGRVENCHLSKSKESKILSAMAKFGVTI